MISDCRIVFFLIILLFFVAGCSSMATTEDPEVVEQPESLSVEDDDEQKTGLAIEREYEMHNVIVAARDIPAGTPLDDEMLSTREVPSQFLPANPLLETDIAIYLDQPIAQDIRQGDMILTSNFVVLTMSRTLSGRIPYGERAVTFAADEISGVTGLLQPGDRVDIIGVFPVEEGAENDFLASSLLQNVTVLAVGEQLTEPGWDGQYDEARADDVTLAMTPQEAELIFLALSGGELRLLVRNREDLGTTETETLSLQQILEQADALNEERQQRFFQRPRRPSPCPPGQERNAAGDCNAPITIQR